MKYVCLGYIEQGKFENMSDNERDAMVDRCFDYDDVLRRNGQFAGGEALQPANTAVTLRFTSGKVTVTDGPYAETKEQMGGFWIIEAADLDAALAWATKAAAACEGPVEVRPTEDA